VLTLLAVIALPSRNELLRANYPSRALYQLGAVKSPSSNRNQSFSLGDFNTPPEPDITAVVLNWSRLPNVVTIATLLCLPELKPFIYQVIIWNNSPRQLTNRVSLRLPLSDAVD
jgi:hypothetical protein